MPKVTLKSSLVVVYLDSDDSPTATRAVIEETSPGRWVAHAVISPLDLGAFTAEDEAVRAVVDALDRLAFRVGEAFAPAPPSSPSAISPAHLPPMTDGEWAHAWSDPDATRGTVVLAPVIPPTSPGSADVVAAYTSAPPDVRPGEPGAVIIRDPLHGAAPCAPAPQGPLGFPVDIVEVKAK